MPSKDWSDFAYVAVCVHPRSALRQIVERNPRDRVVMLVLVAAFVCALTHAFEYWYSGFFKAASTTRGFWNISAIEVLAALTIWPLLAVPLLYLHGIILQWTGLLLGGVGTTLNVRAAYAWSQVPLIVLGLAYFPIALFSDPPVIPKLSWTYLLFAGRIPPFAAFGIILLPWGVWNLFVISNCLGEVHQISAWRGFGCFILGTILVQIVLNVSFEAAGHILPAL
jgi:hypothetical protein